MSAALRGKSTMPNMQMNKTDMPVQQPDIRNKNFDEDVYKRQV